MPGIFISYARSTAERAEKIASALTSLGYEVWSEDKLPAHRAYSDVINERLRDAKAVLVVWSKDAAASQWVRAEADLARQAGKLIQVGIDATLPPMPFNQIHCVDLSAWSGDAEASEWGTVLASLAELTGGAAASNPAPSADGTPPPVTASTIRQLEPGERPSLARPSRPSIAVLPFKNMSGDPEQEYFADAISEDIVTALSRWRWFFVISPLSSFAYKDRDIGVSRVGHELGVRYALEGSVRKFGRRVRVTAQLVDAADGSHVWADKFDRELVDILALQDEVTQQVVAAIEPEMLHGEGVRIARKSLTDFSALDCFYRGMWHLNTASQVGYDEALRLFREAIRRDPDLPLGHIGLARALYGRAIYGWSSQPTTDLEEARAAAQVAISLDARDAWAYFASAGACLYLGEHGAALDAARRAIMLNPNFAYGHYRFGQVLIFSGRPAEAIGPIERSLRFSPYDPLLGPMLETLALAHYQARNYDEAARQARAAIDLNDARASAVLAASLARLGQAEPAAEAFAQSLAERASRRSRPAAPYSDPAQLEHLREGFRLAGQRRRL